MIETNYVLCFFVLGCILGSFGNLIAVRLPLAESIVLPASHCRACKKNIPWYFNFPLVGWLVLRGKCFSCKERIPFQYFAVELIMGLLFAGAYYQLGFSFFLIEALIFIFGLVVSSFIDLKYMILPDVFTLGGTALGLLGAALNPERAFMDALIGVLIGGGFLFALAYFYYVFRGIEGLGGGDIKLLAWVGSILGWVSIPFVVMVASIAGLVAGLIVIIGTKPKAGLKTGIPFGPFLSFGAVLFLLGVNPASILEFFKIF